MLTFKRLTRYYTLRLKRLSGSPRYIARGIAIGVFIGLTPTLPLHTVMQICICLATRSSIIASIVIGWIICNPLTFAPIYYFSAKIGNMITPYHLNWLGVKDVLTILISDTTTLSSSLQALYTLGIESIVVLLSGGIVLAAPFGILSYYISLYLYRKYRQKRIEKRILH